MKYSFLLESAALGKSHPARGAWIEIICRYSLGMPVRSHPARGAWIEIGKHCGNLTN